MTHNLFLRAETPRRTSSPSDSSQIFGEGDRELWGDSDGLLIRAGGGGGGRLVETFRSDDDDDVRTCA